MCLVFRASAQDMEFPFATASRAGHFFKILLKLIVNFMLKPVKIYHRTADASFDVSFCRELFHIL